jgi:hypothetical protein
VLPRPAEAPSLLVPLAPVLRRRLRVLRYQLPLPLIHLISQLALFKLCM